MFNFIIDKLPPGPTIFFGSIYVIMPILPEPHLVQKAMMLADGLELAPLDWFDIVAHSAGGLLALAVYLRQRKLSAEAKAPAKTPNGEQTSANNDEA